MKKNASRPMTIQKSKKTSKPKRVLSPEILRALSSTAKELETTFRAKLKADTEKKSGRIPFEFLCTEVLDWRARYNYLIERKEAEERRIRNQQRLSAIDGFEKEFMKIFQLMGLRTTNVERKSDVAAGRCMIKFFVESSQDKEATRQKLDVLRQGIANHAQMRIFRTPGDNVKRIIEISTPIDANFDRLTFELGSYRRRESPPDLPFGANA